MREDLHVWRQPPALIGRAHSHPGTLGTNSAGVLVGAFLIGYVLIGVPRNQVQEELPRCLKAWMGAAVIPHRWIMAIPYIDA